MVSNFDEGWSQDLDSENWKGIPKWESLSWGRPGSIVNSDGWNWLVHKVLLLISIKKLYYLLPLPF